MSLAVRFVKTLAFCAVTFQWIQTSARFIGHVSSSAPLAEYYHKDDVEMIGLSPADDSSVDQRHRRRLPVGTSIFDDDYEDQVTAADRASSSLQQVSESMSKFYRIYFLKFAIRAKNASHQTGRQSRRRGVLATWHLRHYSECLIPSSYRNPRFYSSRTSTCGDAETFPPRPSS